MFQWLLLGAVGAFVYYTFINPAKTLPREPGGGQPLPGDPLAHPLGPIAAATFGTTARGVTCYTPAAAQAIAVELGAGQWAVHSMNPLTNEATIEPELLTGPSGGPQALAFIAAAAVSFDVYLDTSILVSAPAVVVVTPPGQLPVPDGHSSVAVAASPLDAAGSGTARLVLFAQAGANVLGS